MHVSKLFRFSCRTRPKLHVLDTESDCPVSDHHLFVYHENYQVFHPHRIGRPTRSPTNYEPLGHFSPSQSHSTSGHLGLSGTYEAF